MLTDTKMKTIQLIKDNCILPVHVFHFNADWLFLSLAAFLVHRPAAAASTALHACSTRQHGLQSQWRRRGNFPGTSCSHSSFGWRWYPHLTSLAPPQKHKLFTKTPECWKWVIWTLCCSLVTKLTVKLHTEPMTITQRRHENECVQGCPDKP